jgi:hypothetical protein
MGTCRLSPDRLAGRIGAADRAFSNRIAAALDGEPRVRRYGAERRVNG